MQQSKFPNHRSRLNRVIWTGLALAGIIFTFSPILGNHIASVTPTKERTAPLDFTLTALDGGTWSLSDHRGKVVLVNFWATWCPPCRIETPDLVDTHKMLSERGFTIIGVSLDEEPHQAVPDFVKQYRVPYPILLPSPGVGDQISSLPTSLLLDKNGRIARTYRGIVTQSRLAEDIEVLLKESQTAERL